MRQEGLAAGDRELLAADGVLEDLAFVAADLEEVQWLGKNFFEKFETIIL